MRRAAGAWLLAMLLAAAPAPAQSADSAAAPPRGLQHEASVRLRPRVSTASAPGAEAVRWEPVRVRLQGRLALGPASSRLQVDYEGGEWSVDDAWVRLRARSAELLLGQAKRPFTVLSMRGGSQLGPASRGASLRGVDPVDEQNLVSEGGFGDRAVGVQVAGPLPLAPRSVHATAGLFPADPWGAPFSGDGLQGSLRVAAEVGARVTVGGAWSRRLPGRAADGTPAGIAVGLDVEAGDDAPGMHLLAEVVAGRMEGPGAGRFRGAHVWLMCRTREAGPARLTLEPVLRWSAADGAVPGGGDTGTLITPGVNLYLGDPARWNRLMVNYDLWVPHAAGARARSLKVQLQVGV